MSGFATRPTTTSGHLSNRVSSPSRLSPSARKVLNKKWNTIGELNSIHREIDSVCVVDSEVGFHGRLGGEESGYGRCGLGGPSIESICRASNVERSRIEQSITRNEKREWSACKAKKKMRDESSVLEIVRNTNEVERKAKLSFVKLRKEEDRKVRQMKVEDVRERRRVKELEEKQRKQEENECRKRNEEEWKREKKIQQDKKKADVLARRKVVIENRKNKLIIEKNGIKEKGLHVGEKDSEYLIEQEFKKEVAEGKRVKSHVWNDISRLPKNVSLLDIPFGS